MEIILFVLSSVIVINYFIKVVSCIAHNEMSIPFPILHIFGVYFGNTYISTIGMAYQVYFWASYVGIFGEG